MGRLSFRDVIALWFGFSRPVSRRVYLTTGVLLMIVKYAVEAAVVRAATGRWWTPLDYFSPSLSRYEALSRPLAVGLGAWSLPFIWIGASMTVRRAWDAGLSARFGLLFFLPIVNDLVMIVLAAKPSATRPPLGAEGTPEQRLARVGSALRGATIGVAVGILIVAANTAFSAFVLKSYGTILFVGTPFVVGFVAAALFNHDAPRTAGATIGVAAAAITAAAGALMLLALEGAICLAMAYPLALGFAVVGALLGRAITLRGQQARLPVVLLALALPALMGVSARRPPGDQDANDAREVASSIDIAAPPAVVWRHVIGFSDLPPPNVGEWLFRAGIAYPVRARIDGEGVAAVRRCEFSTGPFVEPITVWDPPRRLAFDVREAPPGMSELSPYHTVHAPHTSGYLVSRRGEFRLVAQPDGATRLEGSTFYTLEIFPRLYWTRFADRFIHDIHMRVLRHIKALAEADRL